MRYFLLFTVATLSLTECTYCTRSDLLPANNKTIDVKEIKKTKPLFHPLIMEKIEEYADMYSVVYGDSINISQTCFPLICTDAEERKAMVHFDTTLIITLYRHGFWDFNTLGYKGIIPIDSINIAIFDKHDMGVEYYNSFMIENIPLETYKCFDVKIADAIVLFRENGVLKEW